MIRKTRLECLVDAIWEINGARSPEDVAYHARNPLRLQVFTEDGRATGKLRVFSSLHGGALASLFDLRVKCLGSSRAKLKGDDFNLRGLMRAYNLRDTAADSVARFLRRALADQTIKPTTSLSYFVEDIQIHTDSARAESEKLCQTQTTAL